MEDLALKNGEVPTSALAEISWIYFRYDDRYDSGLD
jgi:hypothetical protein